MVYKQSSGHLLSWKFIYREKFGLYCCVFFIHPHGENRSGGVRVWENFVCGWNVQIERRGIMLCRIQSFVMAGWGFKGTYRDSWIFLKPKFMSVEILPNNLPFQIWSFSEMSFHTLRIQEKSMVSIVIGAVIYNSVPVLWMFSNKKSNKTSEIEIIYQDLGS